MPPRAFTNPAPLTESAREARKSFFCELCQKGYSRMNEYEAHESSYDHQHKKRLKDMKQMQRDPNASDKARRAERKADEKSGMITIKPLKIQAGGAGKSGFKKGGFKSAFGGPVDAKPETSVAKTGFKKIGATVEMEVKSTVHEDSDDSMPDYEYYDPRRPTGCSGDCGMVTG